MLGRVYCIATFSLSFSWGFFHIQLEISNLPGDLSQVQHSTWLGEPMAVPCGHNTAMGERPGADIADTQLGVFFIFYPMSLHSQMPSVAECSIVLG